MLRRDGACLVQNQARARFGLRRPDLVLHLGDVSYSDLSTRNRKEAINEAKQ
jgi:hypothetical protein